MPDDNPLRTAQDMQGYLRSLANGDPNYEYSSVLPFKYRKMPSTSTEAMVSDPELTFPFAGMAQSAANGLLDLVEGPRRAKTYLQGNLPATEVVSPEGISALAGAGLGASRLVTQPGEASAGMFMGRGAAGADLKTLQTAEDFQKDALLPLVTKRQDLIKQKMRFASDRWEARNQNDVPRATALSNGLTTLERQLKEVNSDIESIRQGTSEASRKQTGWFNHFPDKQWRFEVGDEGASIKQLQTNGGTLRIFGKREDMPKLEDILDHPKLYAMYPELRNIPVRGTGFDTGLKGYYNPDSNTIGLNSDLYKKEPEAALSTLLHEIQHYVQTKEGFAMGGAPEDFLPKDFHEKKTALTKETSNYETAFADEVQDIINKHHLDLSGENLRYRLKDVDENKFVYKTNSVSSLGRYLRPSDAEIKAFKADLESHPDVGPLVRNWRKLDEMRGQENDAFEQYQKLAGEAESRLVETRTKLTPEARRAGNPADQFEAGLEPSKQIVRFRPVQGNPLQPSIRSPGP